MRRQIEAVCSEIIRLNVSDLENIDFQNSFILDWRMEGSDLVFDIEACLTQDHPSYVTPKPGEAMCWALGRLVFDSPAGIHGLKDKKQVRSTTDQDGSRDYGEIEVLAMDATGEWRMVGEFGEVTISGATISLTLEAKNT